MTLSEIASFVCNKVNQTEAEDVQSAKDFCKRRFQMIWQDQLWKDSLFEYTQTLTSLGYLPNSTWLPVSQVLLCPVQVAQPVAVRTDKNKMNVESSETFYRSDFDVFVTTGVARQYRLLPPIVWQVDSARQMSLSLSAAGSGLLDSDTDGIALSRIAFSLDQTTLTFTGLHVNALSKQSGVTLVLRDLTSNLPMVTVSSTDLVAVKRQRLHLIGSVANGTVVRVLAKVKPPTFELDNDEAALTGVDNCLIAFTQMDMLERERQYGKAQAVSQEATMLLDQLKREQTVQQAYNKRFLPEAGYGPDIDFRSGVALEW